MTYIPCSDADGRYPDHLGEDMVSTRKAENKENHKNYSDEAIIHRKSPP